MREIGKSLGGGVLLFCLFLAIVPAYALFSTHLKKESPAPSKHPMRLASSLSGVSTDLSTPASGYEDLLARDIRLSAAELTIDVGYMEQLISLILPLDAAEGAVRWFSDNESVATVDTTGLVCGVSAGTAIIKAITADGERQATCRVTVVDQEAGDDADSCTTANGLALWLLAAVPVAFRGRDARRRRQSPGRRAS